MEGVSQQWVKTGDDPAPVEIRITREASQEKLVVPNGSTWAKPDEEISINKLRSRIEPWLTALFQSEHLNLLLGSGLTTAIQQAATGLPPKGMGWISDLAIYKDEINAHINSSAAKAGRGQGNIEDQIKAINEIIAGFKVISSLDHLKTETNTFTAAKAKLEKELERCLKSFAEAIMSGETAIRCSREEHKNSALNNLVSFLMSFASRVATRDRLHIFTTNYDRLIELGAELSGIRLVDRFVGNLSPIFRSSRLEVDFHYNPPGIRGEPRYLEGVARFTKLHGSLDWFAEGGNIRKFGLPFGANTVAPFLDLATDNSEKYTNLMIYPNSAKDRETSEYPYVELFRDFAAANCRPNSTLVTYGYSFGDEHINRVIADMLTIPSTHLVIIAYGDPLNRIQNFYKETGRAAQISIMLGDHVADFNNLVNYYLPKPAIDRTSIKMAELLKARGLYTKEPDESQVQGVQP